MSLRPDKCYWIRQTAPLASPTEPQSSKESWLGTHHHAPTDSPVAALAPSGIPRGPVVLRTFELPEGRRRDTASMARTLRVARHGTVRLGRSASRNTARLGRAVLRDTARRGAVRYRRPSGGQFCRTHACPIIRFAGPDRV